VADEDAIHAAGRFLIAYPLLGEDQGGPRRELRLGPDRAGNVLEIVVLLLDDGEELVSAAEGDRTCATASHGRRTTRRYSAAGHSWYAVHCKSLGSQPCFHLAVIAASVIVGCSSRGFVTRRSPLRAAASSGYHEASLLEQRDGPIDGPRGDVIERGQFRGRGQR